MRILSITEEKRVEQYIELAIDIAKKATCTRSKCGCVIVHGETVIGKGFNSPPGNLTSQCRCSNSKDEYHKKVTDKTCCVHAEQRAIMDALTHHPDKIKGSRLYFIRLDEEDKKSIAGKPYCTICSKMALDSGVKEFVLLHDNGITVYNTEEYNDLSYKYSD